MAFLRRLDSGSTTGMTKGGTSWITRGLRVVILDRRKAM
jgi:hypothetical protein